MPQGRGEGSKSLIGNVSFSDIAGLYLIFGLGPPYLSKALYISLYNTTNIYIGALIGAPLRCENITR